jgi:hypothetical protein
MFFYLQKHECPFFSFRTPIGRVTVTVVHINDPFRVELREGLIEEGLFPPSLGPRERVRAYDVRPCHGAGKRDGVKPPLEIHAVALFALPPPGRATVPCAATRMHAPRGRYHRGSRCLSPKKNGGGP